MPHQNGIWWHIRWRIFVVSLCSTVQKGQLVRHPGVPPKMKTGAPRDKLKNGRGRGWAVPYKTGSICHFAFSLVLQCLRVSRYPDAPQVSPARHEPSPPTSKKPQVSRVTRKALQPFKPPAHPVGRFRERECLVLGVWVLSFFFVSVWVVPQAPGSSAQLLAALAPQLMIRSPWGQNRGGHGPPAPYRHSSGSVPVC